MKKLFIPKVFKRDWEIVTETADSESSRLMVFGGWLVRVWSKQQKAENIVYIADPEYLWVLEK